MLILINHSYILNEDSHRWYSWLTVRMRSWKGCSRVMDSNHFRNTYDSYCMSHTVWVTCRMNEHYRPRRIFFGGLFAIQVLPSEFNKRLDRDDNRRGGAPLYISQLSIIHKVKAMLQVTPKYKFIIQKTFPASFFKCLTLEIDIRFRVLYFFFFYYIKREYKNINLI